MVKRILEGYLWHPKQEKFFIWPRWNFKFYNNIIELKDNPEFDDTIY